MENQIIQEQELILLESANKQPFSDGLFWLKHAWHLTKARFWRWMLISFIMNLCITVVSTALTYSSDSLILANVAQILSGVLNVLFTGGLLLGMAALAEGDELEVNHLFAAFQHKWQDLLILILCFIPIVLLYILLMGGAFFALLGGGNITSNDINTNSLIIFIIFFVLSYFFMMMVGFFSIPLVVLHDVKPLTAIKMSFSGSLKNIAPMIALNLGFFVIGFGLAFILGILFGLLSFALNHSPAGIMATILTMAPLFIIMALLLPILNAGVIYTAYRNVWTNLPLE